MLKSKRDARPDLRNADAAASSCHVFVTDQLLAVNVSQLSIEIETPARVIHN